MSYQSKIKKDVFIIHSRSDPWERSLANCLEDQLWSWGLSTYNYEDWRWEIYKSRTYASNGRRIDWVKYHSGNSKPFIKKNAGYEVDEEWLERTFKWSNVIIILNTGSSKGKELEKKKLTKNVPIVEVRQVGDYPRGFNPLSFYIEKGRIQEELIKELAGYARFASAIKQITRSTNTTGILLARYLGRRCHLIAQILYSYIMLLGTGAEKPIDSMKELVEYTEKNGIDLARWYENNFYSLNQALQAVSEKKVQTAMRFLMSTITDFYSAWTFTHREVAFRSEADWLIRSSYEARVGRWNYSASSAENVLENKESSLYFPALFRYAVGKHYYGRTWKTEYDLREAKQSYDAIIMESDYLDKAIAELFRGIFFRDLGNLSDARHTLNTLAHTEEYPAHIRAEAFIILAELAHNNLELKQAALNFEKAIVLAENRSISTRDDFELTIYDNPLYVLRRYTDLMRTCKIGYYAQELRARIGKATVLQEMGDSNLAKSTLDQIDPINIPDYQIEAKFLELTFFLHPKKLGNGSDRGQILTGCCLNPLLKIIKK